MHDLRASVQDRKPDSNRVMTLLLFHNPPTSLVFWLILLGMIVVSPYLVIRGIFGFVKSGRKEFLVVSGAVAFAILMAGYFLFESPILATMPWGFGAVFIPYIFVTGSAPGNEYPPMIVYLSVGIGCLLNIIGWFSLVDLIAGPLKRRFGPPILSGNTSDRRTRLR